METCLTRRATELCVGLRRRVTVHEHDLRRDDARVAQRSGLRRAESVDVEPESDVTSDADLVEVATSRQLLEVAPIRFQDHLRNRGVHAGALALADDPAHTEADSDEPTAA